MKKTTSFRVPIAVETRVAITLYYMSDEGRYRKVANAFGVSLTSVRLIVHEVCECIVKYMGHKLIKPIITENQVKIMVNNFEDKHGFSQCIGVVDGTHIDIVKPPLNSADYINRKQRYSLNIQAACDYLCLPIVICAKY